MAAVVILGIEHIGIHLCHGKEVNGELQTDKVTAKKNCKAIYEQFLRGKM